jgi:hypothetical protein
MRRWIPWGLLSAGAVLVIGLLFGVPAFIGHSAMSNEIGLPILAISGVIALLGALAVVSFGFALMNMQDKTQALGLPAGSVRAVIALCLIVLFAILSFYLFSNLQTVARLEEHRCLTRQDYERTVENAPPGLIHLALQLSADQSAKCPSLISNETAEQRTARLAEPRYLIKLRMERNQAGEDFAKQLLVLIGTLVTSVSSFYFGSQAVSQAQSVVTGITGPPTIIGVSPGSLVPGAKAQIDVMGDSLSQTNKVQLIRDGATITAMSVLSNAGRARADIYVPPDAGEGEWDVAVSDSQGRSTRLPRAIRITRTGSGASDGSGTPTKPSDPDPTSTSREPTNTGSTTPPSPTSPDSSATAPPQDEPAALAVAQDSLRQLVADLSTERQGLTVLGRIDTGNQRPVDASALIAAVDNGLQTLRPFLDGNPRSTDVAAAVTRARDLLQTTRDAGLPGLVADSLAVLRGVAEATLPVVTSIPGGPVSIAAGILLGGLKLYQNSKAFDALKSALLIAPYDPDLLPTVPDANNALAALQAAPLLAARAGPLANSLPFAGAVMQAALRRDPAGALVPSDLVAAALLHSGPGQDFGLAGLFASPDELAEAIEAYRGSLIFNRARQRLKGQDPITVPTDAGGVQLDLAALLDGVLALRTDLRATVAIERLVATVEALAKLPANQQATADLVRRSISQALDILSQGHRTMPQPSPAP